MTEELHPGLGSGALREALEKLSNEASGMLGLSGVREAIGNTNMACLQLRVDEARALLSLSSPIEAPLLNTDDLEAALKDYDAGHVTRTIVLMRINQAIVNALAPSRQGAGEIG